MATINPDLVPTINPGDLFDRFTEDSTLNVRWLTATDPAYFEVLNRPTADITVRQLILAKAIDDLNTSLGYQAIFPFIVPPQVSDGTAVVDIPIRIFWDFRSKNTKAEIKIGRDTGGKMEYMDVGQDNVIDVPDAGRFVDGGNAGVILKISMKGPEDASILVDTSWQLWGLDIEIEGVIND